MKKGQEPAFPMIEEMTSNYGDKYWQTTPGMSTRLKIASDAIDGILSNPGCAPTKDEHFMNIVEDALRFADLLIEQEEKTRYA